MGLAQRLLLGQLLGSRPSWDGVIYERAARHLAEGHGYTLRMLDPSWAWPDLPTAFYPPGWPALLSLVKATGAPRPFDLVLQALLGGLAIPLAAALGGALHGHRGARRAAWLVALWPGGWLLSAAWMGEPLFTVLLLAALLPLAGRAGNRPLRYAVSAVLFGCAAYVRPTALVMAPLALFARAWTSGHALPRRTVGTLFAVAFATLALLPVAPWMARNAERLGAPVISSSAGANLYVGALSTRFQRIDADFDCPAGPRELARDRCRRARALSRIEANPGRWLLLGVGKLGHTFGYEATPALQVGAGLDMGDPTSRYEVWFLSGACTAYWLALLAMALSSRGRRPTRWVLWSAVAGVAITHFVFLGGDRYHLPLVPIIAALASGWSRSRVSRAAPPVRTGGA